MIKKSPDVVFLADTDFLLPLKDIRMYKEAKSIIKKFKIVVFCWNNQKNPIKNEKYEEIEINRIYINYRIKNKFLYHLILYFLTIKQMKNIYPKIIHMHRVRILPIGVLLSFFKKSKTIYDPYELSYDMDTGKKFNFINKVIEFIFIPFVDYFISTNEERLKYRKDKHKIKESIYLLNVPIKDSNNCLINKKKENKKIRFFYHGAIRKERATNDIIKATHELKKFENLFEIFFYGTPFKKQKKYEQIIKEKKINNIYFKRPIEMEKLEEIMLTMDIGIVAIKPSSLNNYLCAPNKLYDYMKAGLAILGPDFPGMKKIIVNEKIGSVCNFENTESIKKEILFFINNKENIKKFKTKSLINYYNKYNWEIEEKKLLLLYDKIMYSLDKKEKSFLLKNTK